MALLLALRVEARRDAAAQHRLDAHRNLEAARRIERCVRKRRRSGHEKEMHWFMFGARWWIA